jgi:hypothetical protein
LAVPVKRPLGIFFRFQIPEFDVLLDLFVLFFLLGHFCSSLLRVVFINRSWERRFWGGTAALNSVLVLEAVILSSRNRERNMTDTTGLNRHAVPPAI